MIRILITIPLNPKAIDLLNEIPEFEINAWSGPTGQWLDELQNADVLVCGDSLPATEKILSAGGNLKLVITSSLPGSVDQEAAKKKSVEVRHITAGRATGSQAVAILKDFFNV